MKYRGQTISIEELNMGALIDKALNSGLYTKTTEREWKRHIDFCSKLGQVEYFYSGDSLIGFATWYRTDDYKEDILKDKGEYVVIPFIFIRKPYRNLFSVKKLLRERVCKNYSLGKLQGVKYIVWKRGLKDSKMRKLKLSSILDRRV